MGNKGYGSIPGTLFECITFLARALPVRSVPTFIELLIGAMLTQNGFVTGAWLAINPLRSWSAYYKWLQEGKWSWVALGVQVARMVVTSFPQPVWFLIFDDTFIYRSSSKAPGSGVYHQHGNKANRPQYARGQCWVSMALSFSKGKKHSAIPLLSRLMRTDQHRQARRGQDVAQVGGPGVCRQAGLHPGGQLVYEVAVSQVRPDPGF